MFALRNLSRLKTGPGRRSYAQFIGSAVSSMPRCRLTTLERVAHTVCLFGLWFPYPIWVLWNLEYYKRAPGAPPDS